MVWKVGSRVQPKRAQLVLQHGPGEIIRKQNSSWVVRLDKDGTEMEFTGQQLKKADDMPTHNPPTASNRTGATSRTGRVRNGRVTNELNEEHDVGEDSRFISSRPQAPNIFDVETNELFESDDDGSTTIPLPPPKSFGRFTKGTRVRPRAKEWRQYVGTILKSVGKAKWKVKFDFGILEQEVWASTQLVRASLNDDSSDAYGSCYSGNEEGSGGSNFFPIDEDGVENLYEEGGDVSEHGELGTMPTEASDQSFESVLGVGESSIEVMLNDNSNDGGVAEASDEIGDEDETEPPDNDDRIDAPINFGLLDKPERRAARARIFAKDYKEHVEMKKVIEVVDSQTSNIIKWQVIENHVPTGVVPTEYDDIGVRLPPDFDLDNSETPALDMFIQMLPGKKEGTEKVWDMIRNMNYWIRQKNISTSTQRKVKEISEREFYVFLAILILSTGYVEQGENLWKEPKVKNYFTSPNLKDKTGMNYTRFNEIKKFFVYAFCEPGTDTTIDPWWRFRGWVNSYNNHRSEHVASSIYKILDESMSAWNPQASPTGGLPCISFILRKPKPLGTEFKSSVCPKLNIGTALEIQEGKDAMRKKPPANLGVTASCTHRLVKLIEGGGRNKETQRPSLVLADSWFGTFDCGVNLVVQGHEFILVIKTGHRKTPRKYFDKLMQQHPPGSQFVCQTQVETESGQAMKLIFVSYKYNTKKVLHFLTSENAGSTVPDPLRPYHARFADLHGNITRRDISRPAVLSTYFEHSNSVDVFNQKRQHELGLEQKWVTRDPWFRLATTMVGIITVDAKEALAFHLPGSNELSKATTKTYAGALVHDILVTKYASFSTDINPGRAFLPLLVEVQEGEGGTTSLSTLTDDLMLVENRGKIVSVPLKVTAPEIPESYRARHMMAETTELMSDGVRLNRKLCKGCKRKSIFKCYQCNKFYCEDGSGKTKERYCFYEHVCEYYSVSGYAGQEWKEEYQCWQTNMQREI